MKCDVDIRRDLYANIVMSGGTFHHILFYASEQTKPSQYTYPSIATILSIQSILSFFSPIHPPTHSPSLP